MKHFLVGSDKEKSVLTPQTKDYNQFGQECVGVGCSVDLFLFNNAYIDVATLSQVKLWFREIFFLSFSFYSDANATLGGNLCFSKNEN